MARKTNIEINGKKYYRIYPTVLLADGTKIRKQFYGDCKSDAEAERDKFVNEQELIRQNGIAIIEGTPIKTVLNEWVYDVIRLDSSIKASSFERYEGLYRNYLKCAEIGENRLAEISKHNIQMFYNRLYENSSLTKSQILSIHKLLRKFFFYCIDHQLISNNPCSKVALPGEKGYDDVKIEIFRDDEIKRIINQIENHPYKLMILFAFGTGMRLGELMALKHKDIVDGIVNVSWTLSEHSVIDGKGKSTRITELQIPKSKSSIRSIPLPYSLLKEYYQGEPEQFLFLTSNGNHISKSSFRKAWKLILEKANVPYRKFHCTRHTYITKLVQKGAKLAVVKELAGHGNINMTMRYTHINLDDKTKAVKVLDDLF